MAARIKCIPCSMGDCDNHREGQTFPDLMGGWRCPCMHSEYERREARQRHRTRVEAMLSPLVPDRPRDVPAARRAK